MTLGDVLQDLIQRLDSQGDGIIAWEQIREWPQEAVEIFQNAGWIKTGVPVKSVLCPGCEENCFMPVHASSTMHGKSVLAFVACDRRDDMGRIRIPPDYLQQWQVTENQIARWLGAKLGIRNKPKKNKTTQTIQIGSLRGNKKAGCLELASTAPVSLKVSEHSLPLNEIIYFESNQLQIDRNAILNMVDRSPPSNRYQPSNARREARKLDTYEMYKSWQKEYQKLKRKRQNMSDVWYSQQIAKMDIAQSRSAETIRKEMKK